MRKLFLIAFVGMFVCVQVGCQSFPLASWNKDLLGKRNNNTDFASYAEPLPTREHLISHPVAKNNLVNYPLGYQRGNQPCRT